MTGFDKKVRRRTVCRYQFTICGAFVVGSGKHGPGKRLIAELVGDEGGDFIRVREEKRQKTVELDIGGLYVRGLRALAAKARAERRKGKQR